MQNVHTLKKKNKVSKKEYLKGSILFLVLDKERKVEKIFRSNKENINKKSGFSEYDKR